MSLKCENCGAEITKDTKFCPECGKKIIFDNGGNNCYEDTDSFKSIEFDPGNYKKQYDELSKNSKKFNVLLKAKKYYFYVIAIMIFEMILGLLIFTTKLFTEEFTGNEYSIISIIHNKKYFTSMYPDTTSFNLLDISSVLVFCYFVGYITIITILFIAYFDKKHLVKHYCADSGLEARRVITNNTAVVNRFTMFPFVSLIVPFFISLCSLYEVETAHLISKKRVFNLNIGMSIFLFALFILAELVPSLIIAFKQNKLLDTVFPKPKIKKRYRPNA